MYEESSRSDIYDAAQKTSKKSCDAYGNIVYVIDVNDAKIKIELINSC